MTPRPGRLDHQVQIRLTTEERDEYQQLANERFEGKLSRLFRAALRDFVDRVRTEQEAA